VKYLFHINMGQFVDLAFKVLLSSVELRSLAHTPTKSREHVVYAQ
jgi:hypothetical protein